MLAPGRPPQPAREAVAMLEKDSVIGLSNKMMAVCSYNLGNG